MYPLIKRFFDIILSFFGLLVLAPLLIIIAILLVLDFKGTPFFTQKRPGKDEQIFQVLKFKTMNNRTDEEGNLLPDTDRLTPLGVFVRKTSIDELPQLVNVLMGDMSLIGPRPLLVKYLPYYTEEERIRFNVKPGITGLAQISGRNFLTWEQKFEKDVTYVQQLSFKEDAKIFFKTILKVFKSEGVEVDQSFDPMMIPLDILRKDKKDIPARFL
jgi:lipopolysaccharide/colanic/teichoic acid biosynthesis glycosyltransferase